MMAGWSPILWFRYIAKLIDMGEQRPRMTYFFPQALQGEDISIYGDGSQTRSFQYVSDLVDGLISLMESNYTE